jgi:hypothetical protein
MLEALKCDRNELIKLVLKLRQILFDFKPRAISVQSDQRSFTHCLVYVWLSEVELVLQVDLIPNKALPFLLILQEE